MAYLARSSVASTGTPAPVGALTDVAVQRPSAVKDELITPSASQGETHAADNAACKSTTQLLAYPSHTINLPEGPRSVASVHHSQAVISAALPSNATLAGWQGPHLHLMQVEGQLLTMEPLASSSGIHVHGMSGAFALHPDSAAMPAASSRSPPCQCFGGAMRMVSDQEQASAGTQPLPHEQVAGLGMAADAAPSLAHASNSALPVQLASAERHGNGSGADDMGHDLEQEQHPLAAFSTSEADMNNPALVFTRTTYTRTGTPNALMTELGTALFTEGVGGTNCHLLLALLPDASLCCCRCASQDGP